MLKYLLSLSVLVGTCGAQNAHSDAHPIAELQGTSRVLIVFAPDTNSASFKRQLELIERHAYELTERNTVVVPVSYTSTGAASENHFPGENIQLVTSGEQADARTRFHVMPGDFLVILLTQDGTEQIRSVSPVDIHQLTASLDSLPHHIRTP